jgi:hypothetical protein
MRGALAGGQGVTSDLADLVQRLADSAQVSASPHAVRSSLVLAAQNADDVALADEMARAVVCGLPAPARGGCYVAIGKIGRNSGDDHCARLLLDLLPGESHRGALVSLLSGLSEVPKGAGVDLSPLYPLLKHERWQVRRGAIDALNHSASPEVEQLIIDHLIATEDPDDKIACHAVLSCIGTPRAVLAIEPNLESRKRDVKASAQWALREIQARDPASA